jgi:hypothetical protein
MAIGMFVDSVMCKNMNAEMAIALHCFSSVAGRMIVEIGQMSSTALKR